MIEEIKSLQEQIDQLTLLSGEQQNQIYQLQKSLTATQKKLGVDKSTDPNSIDYKLQRVLDQVVPYGIKD